MRRRRYFVAYKPYGMLSQFTPEQPGQSTLADLAVRLPAGVYPVGRLDADSEGLLLLSDDPRLNARLLPPDRAHVRTYLAQVEGIPQEPALAQLREGVPLRIAGRPYRTRPAQVRLMEEPPNLPARRPPIRFRKSVPDAWLEISLTEGRNRQVRRMCAAVGHPVLRLVRVRFGPLRWGEEPVGYLQPGEVRELLPSQLSELFKE